MDAIDKKLLELMQIDSKKTTKELSSKLNLSVTAVYERIKKLEREGIIRKYVTILDKTKINKGLRDSKLISRGLRAYSTLPLPGATGANDLSLLAQQLGYGC